MIPLFDVAGFPSPQPFSLFVCFFREPFSSPFIMQRRQTDTRIPKGSDSHPFPFALLFAFPAFSPLFCRHFVLATRPGLQRGKNETISVGGGSIRGKEGAENQKKKGTLYAYGGTPFARGFGFQSVLPRRALGKHAPNKAKREPARRPR